ncbi:unnamed protein product, partial [Laminaria digitata]
RRDKGLTAPPEGASEVDKREHLIQELIAHDLSRCFRDPVDIAVYPKYGKVVVPTVRMDLGTMVSKFKIAPRIQPECKYARKRGSAAFYRDLSRLWDNCKSF